MSTKRKKQKPAEPAESEVVANEPTQAELVAEEQAPIPHSHLVENGVWLIPVGERPVNWKSYGAAEPDVPQAQPEPAPREDGCGPIEPPGTGDEELDLPWLPEHEPTEAATSGPKVARTFDELSEFIAGFVAETAPVYSFDHEEIAVGVSDEDELQYGPASDQATIAPPEDRTDPGEYDSDIKAILGYDYTHSDADTVQPSQFGISPIPRDGYYVEEVLDMTLRFWESPDTREGDDARAEAEDKLVDLSRKMKIHRDAKTLVDGIFERCANDPETTYALAMHGAISELLGQLRDEIVRAESAERRIEWLEGDSDSPEALSYRIEESIVRYEQLQNKRLTDLSVLWLDGGKYRVQLRFKDGVKK